MYILYISTFILSLFSSLGWGGYSLINTEKVDLKKFPKIAKIPRWLYTHVKAGDCLLLPSQMWHVVQSHGDQNIAVSYLFSQFMEQKIGDLNFEDCGDKPNPISLDKVRKLFWVV